MFNMQLAEIEHDEQLRNLMRTIDMPGHIRVAFTREPCFFDAAGIEGDTVQTMVGMKDDKIVGLGCRAVRSMWINGEMTDFGYLSSLRSLPEVRKGTALARAYSFLKTLHDKHWVPGYITTIVEQNKYARTVLTSGKGSLPRYKDWGRITTNVIAVNKRRRKRKSAEYTIKKGNEVPLNDLVSFFANEGRKKQFFPVLRKGDMDSPAMNGLDYSDFHIALENDTIVGACALWNQQTFKQTAITGYSTPFTLVKPVINAYLSISGFSKLPSKGDSINMSYISFICIKDNSTDILRELLESIYRDAQNKKCNFLTIGFHEQDPIKAVVNSYTSVPYYSRLYVVSWPDDKKQNININKDLIPYIEIAAL